MARVPYLDQQDLAAEHRDLLKRSANIFRALANSPEGLRAFHGLGEFIRFKSRLDPRLRELAILMVGYLARSPYEWSHHVEIGKRFGVSEEDIRALMEEAEGRPSKLEPLAKTILQAAREMTRDMAISDATFADLRARLDNERVVDLVITIAFYNAVVRVLASLKVDVEDDYQRYLDAFPLPTGPQ
ncbi:MAG: carboxymuconolactone decarboxylase family protein [Hyphomicrobiaceae bacterium]|nr:carboxymuconolactone decarboxylase family protein [Hyphomicrobiaceae bacterium]